MDKLKGIVVDSCCDLTPELRLSPYIEMVPLKIMVDGSNEYTDDGSIEITELLSDIAASKKAVHTSCPTVEEYYTAMEKYDEVYVVTLSDKLSGSHNTANIAKDNLLEEYPNKKVHIFDSKSASAGELLILLQLIDYINEDTPFDLIVKNTENFISKMHTLFVLEDLSILRKNGRLGKVTGLLASMLNFCPIMSDNGDGEIMALSKVRGIKKSLAKLTDIVATMTENYAEGSLRLVISYCNCLERANKLKAVIQEKCKAFNEIKLFHTGGLSSTYANDGGIILAFSL
ncbi:MAG: DegV family protein [Lachnospiraceae bacterium]|jgi:DegV family protein with EDD domain|nr:DegV family protein [Lachnospiraceae bacterium]